MSEATIWRGPDDLTAFLLPIDAVKMHPRNPRRGDLAVVADSLDRFGQTRPVVAHRFDGEDTPTIIVGNHRWRAAKQLGWTHVAVLVDEMLDDGAATDYLLADNATADKATYDDDALLRKLQSLYDRGGLAGSGFTPDDVDDLIAKANRVGETARQQFEGGYAETPEEEAARAARAGEQGSVRQLPLSYDGEQYMRLQTQLQTLAKEYGTSGVTATVMEAVDRVFEAERAA